jgi:vacuolar-type H+-ATPase subunit H
MSESPLAVVRAAERQATERIAAADAEAGEIIDQAHVEARNILDEARIRIEQERTERIKAARTAAETEAASVLAQGEEVAAALAARAPPDGLVAAMLAAVLPETN